MLIDIRTKLVDMSLLSADIFQALMIADDIWADEDIVVIDFGYIDDPYFEYQFKAQRIDIRRPMDQRDTDELHLTLTSLGYIVKVKQDRIRIIFNPEGD